VIVLLPVTFLSGLVIGMVLAAHRAAWHQKRKEEALYDKALWDLYRRERRVK
jgi:hypothetical protein